jgi:hypothetical protein
VEVEHRVLTNPVEEAPLHSFVYNSYTNQTNFAGFNTPGTYHDSHPSYSHPNRVSKRKGMALGKYYLE